MSQFRKRSASGRCRTASSLESAQGLLRPPGLLKNRAAGFTAADRIVSDQETSPPQAPPFLAGLPPVEAVYDPQQPVTKALKSLIDENYYQGNFESAITTISKQKIPEISNIKTVDQFYYYIDALVTWIPEIRVWEIKGEALHERTVYLRITQFYDYFNQDSLESLQSPIAPLEGANLSPLSLWLRDFSIEWGAFLNTEASRKYLESFKYAPEYSWQDYTQNS
ncbi:hypothetical protein ACFL2V_00240 [Pseudomonadota bacterium]